MDSILYYSSVCLLCVNVFQSSKAPASSSQNPLDMKTNEELVVCINRACLLVMFVFTPHVTYNMSLQKLLNESRANVAVAFTEMARVTSYPIEDYILQSVSDTKVL